MHGPVNVKFDRGTWHHHISDGEQTVTENKTLLSLEEYTSSGGGWAPMFLIRQNLRSIPFQQAGILSENYMDLTAKFWRYFLTLTMGASFHLRKL